MAGSSMSRWLQPYTLGPVDVPDRGARESLQRAVLPLAPAGPQTDSDREGDEDAVGGQRDASEIEEAREHTLSVDERRKADPRGGEVAVF